MITPLTPFQVERISRNSLATRRQSLSMKRVRLYILITRKPWSTIHETTFQMICFVFTNPTITAYFCPKQSTCPGETTEKCLSKITAMHRR